MNLREFVTTTLTEIINGIVDAQKAVAGTNARIVPEGGLTWGTPDQRTKLGTTVCQNVSFDVALTATESSAEKAGIGVWLGSFAFGGQAQSESAGGSFTRVKFSIPVGLPYNQDGG
ncbi:MAG TPA: hypothetical protein VNA25_10990 [Phycisphaerae bacterium]|nr:hypothetical protein [Phycisphaerae bacterium]